MPAPIRTSPPREQIENSSGSEATDTLVADGPNEKSNSALLLTIRQRRALNQMELVEALEARVLAL